MQSGIKAASELRTAFNALVSNDSQRALFAQIENETLTPGEIIISKSSDLAGDLDLLQPHLLPDRATYILLKTNPGDSNGYAAITYVPNAAPVRQKMLFASTRLTLVRELGIERFRETLFVTEKEELTKQGWARHQAHEKLAAPLTEEETGLKGVREAEAAESQGTTGRRGHVVGKIDVKTKGGVVEAIGLLREEGCKGTLVQLNYDLPDEILTLESSTDGVEPADVAGIISATEPRYSFYSHPAALGTEPEIFFIYTCPSASKVKQRMIYSTGKSWVRNLAEQDARITIHKSLEATDPNDLTADLKEYGSKAVVKEEAVGDVKSSTGGFARPKRPGRR